MSLKNKRMKTKTHNLMQNTQNDSKRLQSYSETIAWSHPLTRFDVTFHKIACMILERIDSDSFPGARHKRLNAP